MLFLQQFATAAAKRYSGTFKRSDDVVLPAVRKWLAWNEPNNPIFLAPQWAKIRTRPGTYAASPRKVYAGICTAVWTGVHSTHLANEVVACGATEPARQQRSRRAAGRRSRRLAFLAAVKKFGLKRQLRRLRAPSVLRPTDGVADDEAEGPARRSRSANIGDADEAARPSSTATRSSGSPSTATRRARPTRRSASPGPSRRST